MMSASGCKTVAPVKIVAGNKCDLQESREIPAAVGLDWARRGGCGFMETSARLEVNIEETFALIVRRVVEARRQVGAGSLDDAHANSRGATMPLTPPSVDTDSEKRPPGLRGPNLHGDRVGRGQGGFWKRLQCW